AWRFCDLIELVEEKAADDELDHCRHLAGLLGEPFHRWHVAVFGALRASMEGRLDEAERLAIQTLELESWRGEGAQQAFTILMVGIMLLRGRLPEFEGAYKELIAQNPAVTAVRCGLAYVYQQQHREADARREYEQIAARDFAELPCEQAFLP